MKITVGLKMMMMVVVFQLKKKIKINSSQIEISAMIKVEELINIPSYHWDRKRVWQKRSRLSIKVINSKIEVAIQSDVQRFKAEGKNEIKMLVA